MRRRELLMEDAALHMQFATYAADAQRGWITTFLLLNCYMRMQRAIKLSVLDQTPIRYGSHAGESLQESIRLAKLTDQLGYTRYWLSEHHNTLTLAGAAPEVFIARLAAETTHIRLGSGGIMLPNHSTLKVAENFRLLEALYPGRIDLGVGRAPGGDRLTAQLLNPSNSFDPQEYVRQIGDLHDFLYDEASSGNGSGKIRAIPKIDTAPDLWMLTSSGESAYLAAYFGMALSFAQFINPIGGAEAVRTYRERFRPSRQWQQPYATVGIFAFCADTEEKANEIRAMMDYRLISFERGRFDEAPAPEKVKSEVYSAAEMQRIEFNRRRYVAGTPQQVKQQLTALANEFDVDEIVVSGFAYEFVDRLRSYELLAEAFGLTRPQASNVMV